MPTVLRRLLLWTFICSVSAAPSFIIASGEYHRGAMVAGVVLFIAIYTAATSTEAFERFHRRPFIRRTLYIGYGLRLILSAAFPLGFVGVPGAMVMFVDMWPGILSVGFVDKVLHVDPTTFLGTFLTTIVQGALLNVIVFVIMCAAYAFQRAFMTPPPEFGPKGFDVVMPAQPAPPLTRV